METTIAEFARLEREALLLEDGLVAVITGRDIEDRFFGRQNEIWGRDAKEFIVKTAGVEAVFDRQSLRYTYGNAYGNISGIYPFIDIEDRDMNRQSTVELLVDAQGIPNFTILPVVVGVVAVHEYNLG